MMPYTQISNYDGNQLPPTLLFDGGTQGGPGGGGVGGGKRKATKKVAKKTASKPKKNRSIG